MKNQIYSLNGRPVIGGRVVAIGEDTFVVKKPGREERITVPVFCLILEGAFTLRARYRISKNIKDQTVSIGDFVLCEVIKFDGVFDPSVVVHQINPEDNGGEQ
jgi:hypothetical protein